MPLLAILSGYWFNFYIRLEKDNSISGPIENEMVDVPRFELGASSMPRKRASKLRHTPSDLTNYDAHLRET